MVLLNHFSRSQETKCAILEITMTIVLVAMECPLIPDNTFQVSFCDVLLSRPPYMEWLADLLARTARNIRL
jgi:hypothetical protein